MNKILMQVSMLPNGRERAFIFCVGPDGQINHSINETLVELVRDLPEKGFVQLESIIDDIRSGTYDCSEPDRPDWTGNAAYAWFCPPIVAKGHVRIANENVPEYSEDTGKPQEFSLLQLECVIRAWREFKRELAERGVDAMRDQRVEIPFPMSRSHYEHP
jgi:hypothetical protein